jgi:aspartyl-tRNA(Asn)/glutamyl-tRNA(Gln) amidotransferase subunit C
MAITRETVLHMAELARLRLDEAEVGPLQVDLDKIVAYVAELDELDTKDVPPTTQMAAGNASRPDVRRPGLTPEQALEQAPRSILGGFAVPGFVDET